MNGIHANSTIHREPKALTEKVVATSRGGSKKVKAAQPVHQITTHHHQNTFFSQDFQAVPVNLFRNNGSKYSAKIDAGAFSKLKSATLKITVSTPAFPASEAIVLAPVPHWFERIEIRTQNGSKHLTTIYGDALMFNLNLIDTTQLPPILKGANISPNDWTTTSEVNGQSTRTYYLPLVGTWFDSGVYWSNIDGDVHVDFHPANTIVQSGNASNPLVDTQTITLLVQTENLTSEDEKNHDVFHSTVIQSNRLIDWVPVREFGKSLTAGSQTTIDLDSIVGKAAGLVVMVRNTGASNVNNGKFNYISLGDDAKIDITTVGNKSILGSGVPLDGHYITNELWTTHFNTRFNHYKNGLFIPFTEDIKQAYKGVVNGYIDFDHSGHKLQITPGSVGKNTVQTFVRSSAPTAGNYRFLFKGEYSIPVAFNATTSVMAQRFSELVSVRTYPKGALVPTFDAQMDVSIIVIPTVSFAGREVVEPVYVVPEGLLNVGGTYVSITTFPKTVNSSLSRPGVDGFVSGTYDVDVYALFHTDYHVSDGKVMTETF